MKKPVAKGVTKTVLKTQKKPEAKSVKKLLPFQKNYLKSEGSWSHYLQIYSRKCLGF